MRDSIDRYLGRLGGLLLPPRCVLCGGRGRVPSLDLCAGCEACLQVAGEPVSAGPEPLRHTCAPFAYAWPLDHLVHDLKYQGQLATGRVLGTLLARSIAGYGLQHAVDVIVPVPLHRARHAERGFNQSAELAHRLGRDLGLPVATSLAERRRSTPPQVGLRLEERHRNLAGAFGASDANGLRIAIVDDVMTTGTTLRELACALRQAGARTVDAWCVARADRSRIHSGTNREPSSSAGRMR